MLVSVIIALIYNERSLLFINKALVNISSLSLLLFKGTNFRPLRGLLIYYYKHLFRSLISLVLGFTT